MNQEKIEAMKSLKIARGQIEATMKMLEDGRYCVDVSNQIVATQSLLKKANLLVLKQHINHCVKEAFEEGNAEAKVDEIMVLLAKAMNK